MLDKERKVSFVIPAYNEEESLEELYSLIKENVDDCKKENLLTDYEVLFIDDGSTDHTQDVIRKMSGQDEHVRYIFFRKNFGKSVALQTAFRNVTGDVVITMDADLQDDPCELASFLKKLMKDTIWFPGGSITGWTRLRKGFLQNYLIWLQQNVRDRSA